jgi:hypothetical protein
MFGGHSSTAAADNVAELKALDHFQAFEDVLLFESICSCFRN